MKKIVLVCIVYILTVATTHAQSFQKGSMFIEASLGLGIYNDNVKDKTNGNTSSGSAGSVPIPISFEYGIGRFIGIGARLNAEGFIKNKDSTGKVNSSDFGLFGNVHLLRGKHTDLFAGVGLGVTSFRYNGTVQSNYFKGGGGYADLHVESRFLLSKHFGFLLYYTLVDKNDSNGNFYTTQGVKTDKASINFAGSNFGIGLVYKIR